MSNANKKCITVYLPQKKTLTCTQKARRLSVKKCKITTGLFSDDKIP